MMQLGVRSLSNERAQLFHKIDTALHCTALHCTALHCTALHCTALVKKVHKQLAMHDC
jgi:hypothetical protein